MLEEISQSKLHYTDEKVEIIVNEGEEGRVLGVRFPASRLLVYEALGQ